MSQPCLSKPNQCTARAPRIESARLQAVSVSRGSMRLNRNGNAASSTISSTMPSAIQNTGLRRRSRQASADRSAMANPWVQQRVQQIHHQRGDEVDQDQQAHDGDHARAVLELDALEQQMPDAGYVV